ncbi:hypothetical protein [Paraburkholderia mimosarum]|uniref:hypothetical protein n=1 Tax=Paraburkholderia mimosarum TaxID=312026 RepID=UPI0003F62349|nr:hypothetical protein [Paraburkholderia mimosarum]
MSSNKRLTTVLATTLAAGLVLGIGPANGALAASTPSFDGAIATPPAQSVKTATAIPNTSNVASATSGAASAVHMAAAPVVSASQAAATVAAPVMAPAPASDAHLTLRDIDQLARNKVARALRDGDGAGSATPAAPASAAPLRAEAPPPATPPAPVLVAPAWRSPRVDPVTFVGSFTDQQGLHVLYQYGGAVYPARRGEKLLNGWVVRKVEGLFVTVAEGKATRTVAMRSGVQEGVAPAGNATPVAVSGPLRDVGAPLPPWIAPSTAQ